MYYQNSDHETQSNHYFDANFFSFVFVPRLRYRFTCININNCEYYHSLTHCWSSKVSIPLKNTHNTQTLFIYSSAVFPLLSITRTCNSILFITFYYFCNEESK